MSWGMNQNETVFAPIRQRLFRNRETLALAVNLIWQGEQCPPWCTVVHNDAPPKSPLCKASCSRTRFCCKIGREMKCADCNATNKHNLMQEISSSKTFTADFEISSYLTHPSQTHLREKRLAGQVLYFVSFWKHYLGSLLEPSFRGVRAALAFLRKATTGGWHCVEVAEEAEEGKLWCNSDSKLSVPAGLPGSHLQLASTTGAWRVSRSPPDSCDLKSWNSLQREVKDPICDCWEVSTAKYLQGYCALLWNFSGK